MSEQEYRSATQNYVDRVCHYRNLAIELGAVPDDMTSDWDRSLCEKWPTYKDDPEGWHRDNQQDENREFWMENCVYEDALEAIVADKGNVYAIARKALAAAKEIEGRV